MRQQTVESYFGTLSRLIVGSEVTDRSGGSLPLAAAFGQVMDAAHAAHAGGYKVIFVGNGGSAGIASHMAIDFSKNGGIRSLAFNDGSALTCLGNDLGYENVFAKQIEFHGRGGDVLIAISSSGRSPNILSAVEAARRLGCTVVTLSGFSPDNPLRRLGDVNFYVDSSEYGFVETGHQALIHAMLDINLGWTGEPRSDA
jgi:D-sedoheptulose 7-phosphate isomerase